MRPFYRYIFAICCILCTACTAADGGDPAAPGRIQRIFEGTSAAYMKEVGFTRFDAAGRKTESQYLGTHQRFAYDNRDSLILVTDIDAQGAESKAEVRTYNGKGHLLADTSFTDGAATLIVQFAYDNQGHRRSKTSWSKYAGESTTEFSYEGDRVKTELRKSATGEQTRISYTYNEKGQLYKAEYNGRDPQGYYSETFYYDAAGRLSNKEERSGPAQATTYKRYWAFDPQGHLVETFCNPEDGQGCLGKIIYSYDAAGDLIGKQEYAGTRLLLETAYRWEQE